MFLKFAFVSFVFVMFGCGEQPLQLALQPPAGDTATYRFTETTSMTSDPGGAAQGYDQTLEFIWRDVARASDSESATLDLTVESTSFKQVISADGKVVLSESFSSDDPDSEPNYVTMGYAGMVGLGFAVRATGNGEKLELVGYEAMLKTILTGIYNLDDPAQVQGSGTFARSEKLEAMTDRLRPIYAIYPDGLVKVGDSWTRNIEVESSFPHVRETRFTLVERKDGECRLRVDGTVSPKADQPVSNFGESSQRTLLSGTQTGEFTLDESTGRIIEGRLEIDLSGTNEILTLGREVTGAQPLKYIGTLKIRRE